MPFIPQVAGGSKACTFSVLLTPKNLHGTALISRKVAVGGLGWSLKSRFLTACLNPKSCMGGLLTPGKLRYDGLEADAAGIRLTLPAPEILRRLPSWAFVPLLAFSPQLFILGKLFRREQRTDFRNVFFADLFYYLTICLVRGLRSGCGSHRKRYSASGFDRQ